MMRLLKRMLIFLFILYQFPNVIWAKEWSHELEKELSAPEYGENLRPIVKDNVPPKGDFEPLRHLFDGDPNTYWSGPYNSKLMLDFTQEVSLNGYYVQVIRREGMESPRAWTLWGSNEVDPNSGEMTDNREKIDDRDFESQGFGIKSDEYGSGIKRYKTGGQKYRYYMFEFRLDEETSKRKLILSLPKIGITELGFYLNDNKFDNYPVLQDQTKINELVQKTARQGFIALTDEEYKAALERLPENFSDVMAMRLYETYADVQRWNLYHFKATMDKLDNETDKETLKKSQENYLDAHKEIFTLNAEHSFYISNYDVNTPSSDYYFSEGSRVYAPISLSAITDYENNKSAYGEEYAIEQLVRDCTQKSLINTMNHFSTDASFFGVKIPPKFFGVDIPPFGTPL